MPFFEVSCKMDVNVEEAFKALDKMIKERSQYSVSYYTIISTILIIMLRDFGIKHDYVAQSYKVK